MFTSLIFFVVTSLEVQVTKIQLQVIVEIKFMATAPEDIFRKVSEKLKDFFSTVHIT